MWKVNRSVLLSSLNYLSSWLMCNFFVHCATKIVECRPGFYFPRDDVDARSPFYFCLKYRDLILKNWVREQCFLSPKPWPATIIYGQIASQFYRCFSPSSVHPGPWQGWHGFIHPDNIHADKSPQMYPHSLANIRRSQPSSDIGS